MFRKPFIYQKKSYFGDIINDFWHVRNNSRFISNTKLTFTLFPGPNKPWVVLAASPARSSRLPSPKTKDLKSSRKSTPFSWRSRSFWSEEPKPFDLGLAFSEKCKKPVLFSAKPMRKIVYINWYVYRRINTIFWFCIIYSLFFIAVRYNLVSLSNILCN